MSFFRFHIVPGNPGIEEYYDEFIEKLNTNIKLSHYSITISPHLGHDGQNTSKLHTLQEQINYHEKILLNDNSDKLILIGHSIGCYIILKLIENKLINDKVEQVWLLFPTIERMKDSPKGKQVTPLLNRKLFHWLVMFITGLISFVPKKLKLKILSYYFNGVDYNNHAVRGTDKYTTVKSSSQSLFMAQDEMNNVNNLDPIWPTIISNWFKIKWYYGSNDHWCPIQYYNDMVKRAQDNNLSLENLFLDNHGMEHAFVLNNNEIMAKVCCRWL